MINMIADYHNINGRGISIFGLKEVQFKWLS